jgi:segregation and condensation protein A
MDGIADGDVGSNAGKTRETPPGEPQEGWPAGGEGASLFLTLGGFAGPLDYLLVLARAQKIDLADLSLLALVDQLAAALRQAPATTPLGQKGDWVVMAAWLVQLRAQLLLPAGALVQNEATAEADRLRERLAALEEIAALAHWLERRPQLGHQVFARGQPEVFGVSVDAVQAIDMVEFLWASLALFDDDNNQPDAASVYRPLPLELYAIAEARERIVRLLQQSPEGVTLDRLLPDAAAPANDAGLSPLRRRSAWSSTFIAGLELARQGDVTLTQGRDFQPILVTPAAGRCGSLGHKGKTARPAQSKVLGNILANGK